MDAEVIAPATSRSWGTKGRTVISKAKRSEEGLPRVGAGGLCPEGVVRAVP